MHSGFSGVGFAVRGLGLFLHISQTATFAITATSRIEPSGLPGRWRQPAPTSLPSSPSMKPRTFHEMGCLVSFGLKAGIEGFKFDDIISRTE